MKAQEMSRHVSGEKIRSAFMQGVFFMVLSIILAAAVNMVRPDGFSLSGLLAPPATAGTGDAGFATLTLQEGWSQYAMGKIIFVDARESFAYEQGHLPGAVNVPLNDVKNHFGQLESIMKSGIELITYCDGPDCPLSFELAGILRTNGIRPVRVLVQGWIGWYESGFPIEEGVLQ